MRFTNGYWMLRDGVELLCPRQVVGHEVHDGVLTVWAATRAVEHRGDTLNGPLLTVTFEAVADGVIAVTARHQQSRPAHPGPDITLPGCTPVIDEDEARVRFRADSLTAEVAVQGPWHVDYRHINDEGERLLTSSLDPGLAAATVDGEPFMREQLTLGVGEHILGLGERFGPVVKNGQTIDLWNADGGTASEQAYKNVSFHLSDRGYGIFVDTAGPVSYEIGSEAVSRTQFSVPGHRLRYLVIDGPTPAEAVERWTGLSGRPPRIPDWSWGLWLSTSFTTNYDAETVLSFVDGMAERGLDLSVFHFDCFWMRAYHWCDFTWDPDVFPDPRGLLAALHERGLKVCVWINPYIAERSALYAEGAEGGFLLKRPDGTVWQTDQWQAGMGIVDLTNPAARDWWTGHLRRLLDDGVDCFKTDFGERIPTDVVWHDGSDPLLMHNFYAHLYNRTVFDLLTEVRGEGEAVVFARSGMAGGQQFPVHWGGDCESTYASMAETLRGGLSLASSGFAYWSHDIGGFEGTPDTGVFLRWLAFGLLSSHSRLHGSGSYRVPWQFGDEAVAVAKRFIDLKASLLPYLIGLGERASSHGTPVLRPMVFEFPDDPGAALLDTQYMLGDALLVAPVFSADGEVTFWLPDCPGTDNRWQNLLDGSFTQGPGWITQTHDVDSLPVLLRPGRDDPRAMV